MYIYTLKGWYEMNRTYELLRQEHQLFLHVIEALACYKQAYEDFERVSKVNRVVSLWSLTAQEYMDKKYYERQRAFMQRDDEQRRLDLFRFASDLCIKELREEAKKRNDEIDFCFQESDRLHRGYDCQMNEKVKVKIKSERKMLSKFKDASYTPGFGSLSDISDVEPPVENDVPEKSSKKKIEAYLLYSISAYISADYRNRAVESKKYYSTLHAWVAKVLAPISTRVPCKRFTKARIIFSRADKRARRVLKKYYQYKSRVYEAFVKFFTLYLQYKAVRQELDRLSTSQEYSSVSQQYLRLYF